MTRQVRLDFNIPAMVRHQGRARGELVALIHSQGTLTYRELEEQVCRWSNHFRELGLQQADRIGLCLGDHADHVVAMLASMRAELEFLCLNWKSTQHEIEDRVAEFGLKLVLVDRKKALPSRIGILRDDEWRTAIARAATTFALPEICFESTAMLAASSGSTGRPKAVRVSHGALFARAMCGNWLTHSVDPADTFLRALPLAYTLGRGFGYSYFCAGCASVLPNSLEPEYFVNAVERHRVTHANTNPTILRWLVDHAPKSGYLFPDLKVLVCTGATLGPEQKRVLLERITPNLYEKYGTVAAGIVTVARPNDIRSRPRSVGRPEYGVALEVVDDRGNVLPTGEIGTLRCKSIQSANAVQNESDEGGTGQVETELSYTDDLGWRDDDGYLYLSGRNSSLIVCAAVNIYAEELEMVISDHPQVREVAVLGRPSTVLGEEPVALVVRREGSEIDSKGIILHCRLRLSGFKVPAAVCFVDHLPYVSAGKINRAALPALLHAI